MKLLDDFYHIKEQETSGEAIKILLNGEHFIYKAHFPGNPVTPGVCLVQIAMELLQAATNSKLTLLCASKIKYRNIVKPWDEVRFSFTGIVGGGGVCKARASIKGQGVDYAEMTLNYKSR